jgi:hypothetical protein
MKIKISPVVILIAGYLSFQSLAVDRPTAATRENPAEAVPTPYGDTVSGKSKAALVKKRTAKTPPGKQRVIIIGNDTVSVAYR